MTRVRPDASMVTEPDPRLVASAQRLITRLAEAEGAEAAERWEEKLVDRAMASVAFIDAAFLAAQSLRDLEVLEPAEAAWIFNELFDVWWDAHGEDDAEIRRLQRAWIRSARASHQAADEAMSGMSIDEYLEAAERRQREVLTAFHRARGETRLAELIAGDNESHRSLYIDGYMTLVEEKWGRDEGLELAVDPKRVATLVERLIRLTAAETLRDVIEAHDAVMEIMSEDRTPASIRAVQAVRDLGLLTEAELVALMTNAAHSFIWTATRADRLCSRYERARNAASEGSAAFVDADAKYGRRFDQVAATVLRRFGEHRLADLLMTSPEEFWRMEEEAGLGVERELT